MTVTPLKVHGSDVSHHQGTLNLKDAADHGLQFLYHKATEGTSFVDDEYAARRAAAKKAGIPFGAYHFARPKVGNADEEARHFLSTAKPVAGDLFPALDLETNDSNLTQLQLTRWVAEFVAIVQSRVGVKPVIYTPFSLLKHFDAPLWVPRYNNTNTPPVTPKPWDKWDIWQFSNGVYGVPDSFPGLGHVDLNHLRDGFKVKDIIIPDKKPTPPKFNSFNLYIMHASMQFSDTPAQMEADVKKLFDRAKKKNASWITGTEAGAGADPLRSLLKKYAKAAGFRFHSEAKQDSWIAVNEELIDGDLWEPYYKKVVDGSAGRSTDKGPMSITFQCRQLGSKVTIIACHYMTHGRPVDNPAYNYLLDENTALAKAIGERATEMGRGRDLVFYGGDQNIVDRTDDTFLGAPLTSAWDELNKYENTGHGNIDVIASYDPDVRVTADWIHTLDDKAFFLNTDHYLIEAGYNVKVRIAA